MLAAESRMRRADLERMFEAKPAEMLQVGEDRVLVVWRFEQRWSELEPAVVNVVALEDREGRIHWWHRVPAALAYICWSADCPLCTPTRVLWPLVDGDETPAEREQALRSNGLLPD